MTYENRAELFDPKDGAVENYSVGGTSPLNGLRTGVPVVGGRNGQISLRLRIATGNRFEGRRHSLEAAFRDVLKCGFDEGVIYEGRRIEIDRLKYLEHLLIADVSIKPFELVQDMHVH
jgi:hypothetical protein